MANDHSEKSSVLVTAAKALGSAAGKIASLAKAETPAATPRADGGGARRLKFQPHAKSRLPRKLKKAQKKAAARQT